MAKMEEGGEQYLLIQENLEFRTGRGAAFANRVHSERYDGDIYLVHEVHGAHGVKYKCRETLRTPRDTPPDVVKEGMNQVIMKVISQGNSASG